MVSVQPDLKHPSLDRLDLGRLRRLLADLGLQTSCWSSADSEVKGFSPEAPICQCIHSTQRHCQPFLLQLARDAQANGNLRCRSCMPGAFSLATRLDEPAGTGSPIALGCFVTADLASSQAARERLTALLPKDTDLAVLLQEPARCRGQDVAWLTIAFTRIASAWYTHSCDHAREVEALSQSLADTYEELSAIYRLNEAMNLTASTRDYLQNLAEELRELLAAQAVLISLTSQALPEGSSDIGTICAGEPIVPVERLLANLDMDKLARRGHQVVAIGTDGTAASPDNRTAAQILATPILRGDKRLGVMVAVRTGNRHKINNIDVTRISSIAKSTAMVLENFRLYDNLRQLFLGTLRALTRSIDAKDPYTCGHSERVAILGKRLMLQMGGTAQQAERIYLCGMLHDVGKIGVPEEVLRKPGRPTDEEFALIKRHPVVGAAILDDISELEDVVPGVLHHHERIDGRGYPAGLAGEAVPLYARILAVADTFDAMTSSRPYRTALSLQVTIEEIQRNAGTQLDPAAVQALLQMDLDALMQDLGRVQGVSQAAAAPEPAVSGKVSS